MLAEKKQRINHAKHMSISVSQRNILRFPPLADVGNVEERKIPNLNYKFVIEECSTKLRKGYIQTTKKKASENRLYYETITQLFAKPDKPNPSLSSQILEDINSNLNHI